MTRTQSVPALPTAPDDEADALDARARLSAQAFDRQWHAALAPCFGGLSPAALALAATDWLLHLATQPAQSWRLGMQAQQAWMTHAHPTKGLPLAEARDPRFSDPAWQDWPWAAWARQQLAAEAWWEEAARLRGMSSHHQEMLAFFARQWLDGLSPVGQAGLHPAVLRRTAESLGANLWQGGLAALDEWRAGQGLAPALASGPRHRPGQEVALTPGQVVYRNHLVELIQYGPQTDQVHAEPIFIVPSWIMKFYILDLSPRNSLVRWLVSQGHTVFILSWRNPDEADAELTLSDYLEQGIFDSLRAIARLLPGESVHACGYCLGGTLLAIAAAALARPGQVRQAGEMTALCSVSLLAAETDFSEPGEMGVLIDESQVAWLDDLMAERGHLSGQQMAGSFAFLHARELVWARRLRAHWLGEPDVPNDLMAWNADVTRMPAAMHSEYLHRMYLRNELATGRYPVQDRVVSLSDLRLPLFAVGTEKDHVSPWPSVYKIHQLTRCELSFVLASGGHNAGIVSEPGHPHRAHALGVRKPDAAWLDPQCWRSQATQLEGSWWPTWHDWLLRHGHGRQVEARRVLPVAGLPPAPGAYVMTRYSD